jgi:hypothetical protein
VSPEPTSRGARSGSDLLALVAHDLRPCRVERRGGTAALVTAADGTSFDVTVHIERRKLLTLQELTAHVHGPASSAPEGERLLFHHTGQVRRTGLAAKSPRDADAETVALRDRLLADEGLREACLPLDVTRFTVAVTDGRWRADLRLMGGSHVHTRFPPGGSYVRLATDQVEALIATVRALDRVLPGVAPPPVGVGRTPELPRRDAGSSHLPGARG